MQKDFPEYRHTDHLTIPTLQTRPHTPDSFNPQMNKEKRKSRLSCCVAGSASAFPPCRPKSVRLARLEGSPPRARLTKPKKPLHFFTSAVPLPITPLLSLGSLLLSSLSLFSVHTRFLSSEAPSPWPASFSGPTPLLGVPPLSLPIGRADTPSARQRDRWVFPQLCLADSLPDLS